MGFWRYFLPISRRRYDAKIVEFERRLSDLERHFVTRRDANGEPVETLADVPVDKRDELKRRVPRGMTWQQRKAWLEETDGGRFV